MILVVTDDAVRLDDSDTFTELAVDASPETAGAVIDSTGIGRLDGDHLWIDIDSLRNLGRETDEWQGKFAAMIEYAVRKGWADNENRVRAHIRWV